MHVRRMVAWGLVAGLAVIDGGEARAAGRTLLIEAARKGDATAVRALLKQQPNSVNVADADGTTPLHWATDLDDLATAQLLIRAGANARAANRYGVTPLYSAALHGNAPMLELLLKAGVDIEAPLPEGETALMTAARTGKVDAMRVLIAHGANVNAREKWKQQTALMWAAHDGNAEAVKLLAEAGAKLNERSLSGWTPLLFAARQGQIATIDALVAAGANIHDVLPDGTSALVTAVQGLNYEAATVLLEHGADINARQTKEPTADMEGRNDLNRYGATPLFLAARSVDVPLMEVLLELGADPFIANVDGDSPLMVAAGVGVYSQGESPGLPEESADAVRILLDLGAPVSDVDKNGETAMHGPAWRGSNEAVMLLLTAGARLDVRNSRGWLPLTIAEGVYHNARVMMNKHTAKLIREQMIARGLDTRDEGADLGGAIRGEVEDDTEVDANNPSEIQRKRLEELKKREEALKKLQEQGKQP